MSEEIPEVPPATIKKGEQRGRKPRSASRIAAITLGAIGLAILGLILFVPAPDGGIRPDRTDTSGSARNSGGPTTIREGSAGLEAATEYRPLPALEALIGSLPRRVAFRVVSPDEIVEKGKLIFFRWETEQVGPWKVTILNNQGIALKEEEVKDPEYTLSSPKPALYYWTVAKEDTLLHAGRLAVR